MEKQSEKKSERFEIRIPYSKKQNFITACDEQGDTPSHALRRFIDSYIRRANTDNMKAVLRSATHNVKRKWLRVSLISFAGIVGTLTISGFIISSNQTAQKEKLFAIYDTNNNGLIDLGEISDQDEDLHRVLDIDGVLGIGKKEFQTKGKMVWSFVNPKTFKVETDSRGFWIQKTTTIQTRPSTEANEFTKTIVSFDLTKPDAIELAAWQQKNGDAISRVKYFQRSVLWIKGQNNPVHVIGLDYKLAKVNQGSS